MCTHTQTRIEYVLMDSEDLVSLAAFGVILLGPYSRHSRPNQESFSHRFLSLDVQSTHAP